MRNIRNSKNRGDILVSVIIFAAIAITVVIGLVNWGTALLGSIRNVQQREQALQIAEAGIDYYRWHLAHAPADFKDGTTTPGPYIHTVSDKDSNIIGSYALTITPPTVGSTLVTIVSKGTFGSTTISRSIKAVMAIPSLAKYAAVANASMRFGAGTEIFGPVHSNGGVRFDGIAHNVVTSAVASYNDPDSDDCNGGSSSGVHTCASPADPAYPAAVPSRPDIFMAGRQFPVPSVDFFGLTSNLTQLKALATSSGQYFAPSGAYGYHLVLNSNGSFDVSKVTAVQPAPSGCGTDSTATGEPQWGTWSIQTQGTATHYAALPTNGVLFFEDHVWVDGTINGGRVTVAAGKIGNTNTALDANITVNSNLTYANPAGIDSIGLIAQGNVNVGMYSADNLIIDAALVAQDGRVGRFYYNTNCLTTGTGGQNYYTRSALTLYGMIATNQRYGFAYTDNTGYQTRSINYDSRLLYAPPPSFPLTSSNYQTLSWQEIGGSP